MSKPVEGLPSEFDYGNNDDHRINSDKYIFIMILILMKTASN